VNSTISNRYRFTGREFDEETGLYHYRARAYSPTMGRFLQRDPLEYKDSMNLFQYALNSPNNFIDPSGRSIILLPWAFETAVILGGGFVAWWGQYVLNHPSSLPTWSWPWSGSQPTTNSNVCPVQFQSDNPSDTPSENDLSDKVGDIAEKTGLTEEEVKRKIHEAKKKGLPRSGPIRNPDVGVDTNTGEVYPKTPDGRYGDSIGNIFD
jgi:RHS repeat-associated protein